MKKQSRHHLYLRNPVFTEASRNCLALRSPQTTLIFFLHRTGEKSIQLSGLGPKGWLSRLGWLVPAGVWWRKWWWQRSELELLLFTVQWGNELSPWVPAACYLCTHRMFRGKFEMFGVHTAAAEGQHTSDLWCKNLQSSWPIARCFSSIYGGSSGDRMCCMCESSSSLECSVWIRLDVRKLLFPKSGFSAPGEGLSSGSWFLPTWEVTWPAGSKGET